MAHYPISSELDARQVAGREADGLRLRLKASAVHLALSSAVATCVLGVVYLGWYRRPLDSISGVADVLVLLLAIDVALGPLLTLVVFDQRKKNLPFDLCCIALMQLAALTYGIYTVEAGRPHHLVFVKDRFEVVSRVDLQPRDREDAAENSAADADWFGPKLVAAEVPDSEQERRDLLFESVQGGRDVQHFPKQYRDYATRASLAVGKGQPIEHLRTLNPDRQHVLDAALGRSGVSEENLRFLPIRGPKGDATMLVEASSGKIVEMVNLTPWRD